MLETSQKSTDSSGISEKSEEQMKTNWEINKKWETSGKFQ